MSHLPQGWCPLCGRKVALRRGGQMREHRYYASWPENCRASGLRIAQARAKLDAGVFHARGSAP